MWLELRTVPQDDDKKCNMSPTVFYEMAHNTKVTAGEKTITRLTDEGVLFVVAGNETTGNMLSVVTFHLLNNPETLRKLYKELDEAIPDATIIPRWQGLEQISYLSAVIKEGLRLSYGVVSRMPRVSPILPITYKSWTITLGTPVSMSTMSIHDNASIFPSPSNFQPERWLQPNAAELQKYLVPFCRGTRACVGMNLAYAEIFITVAVLFRRFDFGLWRTGREDVEVAHEYHIPQVKRGSKGVKVTVRRR